MRQPNARSCAVCFATLQLAADVESDGGAESDSEADAHIRDRNQEKHDDDLRDEGAEEATDGRGQRGLQHDTDEERQEETEPMRKGSVPQTAKRTRVSNAQDAPLTTCRLTRQ